MSYLFNAKTTLCSWDKPHLVMMCVFFFKLFIYLFLAALGLHCCAQAFSSCGERGATLRCNEQASHCGGFSCWRSMGSRHVGFSSCGIRAQ